MPSDAGNEQCIQRPRALQRVFHDLLGALLTLKKPFRVSKSQLNTENKQNGHWPPLRYVYHICCLMLARREIPMNVTRSAGVRQNALV